MKGCGAEDAFIECTLFRLKSVKRTMNGSHYFRSFNGLIVMAEAIGRLQIEECFEQWAGKIEVQRASR